MRALVLTVVHHPEDARIRHRQITALLDAGWQVTYAAPFTAYEAHPQNLPAGLTIADLPRAHARERGTALRAARHLLRTQGHSHDIVLLHDPELLLALPRVELPPVVWDVHEDTSAAVSLKPWLPGPLRPATGRMVRWAERFAERHVHLILAEESYRSRFRREHPVVPNVATVPATVPPPDQPHVVYVGHLTLARGAAELVEVGRQLAQLTDDAVRLRLVGHADRDAADVVRPAARDGVVDWAGFLPSDQALGHVDGAMAGLALLHDEPNYRHSMPTKLIEYMARGVPVVTTSLPLARKLVEETQAGLVVPFEDPTAAAKAVVTLVEDVETRHRMGAAGHRAARERFDWRQHGDAFVAELERIARLGGPC